MKIETLVRINDVEIQVVTDNREKSVPIKPICEALGIDRKAQQDKIEEDDFLSSVRVLRPLTGADGKTYEMVCLPLEFIFGWLFTINPKNVKEESRETVAKYRIECYRALYKSFVLQSEFLQAKQEATEKQVEKMDAIRAEFNSAKERLSDARKEFDKIKSVTFEQWMAEQSQLKLFN